MTITLSNTELNTLPGLEEYNEHIDYSITSESGFDHYRLLSYLSTCFNNEILYDIGTRSGASAVALSFNQNNTVKSFDIVNKLKIITTPPNLEFIIEDNVTKRDELLKVKLIMLDVDPHDGGYEKILIDYLIENKWEGLLLLDDTKEEYWPEIYELIKSYTNIKQVDLTKYGHFSGTTCFNFSKDINFNLQ